MINRQTTRMTSEYKNLEGAALKENELNQIFGGADTGGAKPIDVEYYNIYEIFPTVYPGSANQYQPHVYKQGGTEPDNKGFIAKIVIE